VQRSDRQILRDVDLDLRPGDAAILSGAAGANALAICRELGLGPLIERMPAGLGQVVGQTGWRLSQGERARLSSPARCSPTTTC